MKHEIRNATCRVGAKRRRESEARSKPGPAVAQICNLLCRRFSICCAWKGPEHAGESTALPTASRRYSAARRSRNQSSAELYSAVSPRLSGCFEVRMYFRSMFMRLVLHSEGVTDLNLVHPRMHPWPLSCCHELRSIRPFPTAGFSSSRAVPSLCHSLWRGLQSSTLLLLAAVRLFGLRPTDLARKPARHRSLSQRARPATLSLGIARSRSSQHPGRCSGRTRLAHLRRSGSTTHWPGAPALRSGSAGFGFGANHLRAGRQHHRPVFVGLSLGALRRVALGPQNPHPTGTALAFARANAGQSGHLPGGGLVGPTALRTGRLLPDGPRVCGLAPTLCHRTSARLVCGASQKIAPLLPAALPADRSGHWIAQRPDHQLAGVLRRQGVSGQTEARAFLRPRASARPGVFDQSLWVARPDGGPALPA